MTMPDYTGLRGPCYQPITDPAILAQHPWACGLCGHVGPPTYYQRNEQGYVDGARCASCGGITQWNAYRDPQENSHAVE